ncbi:MAG TPA: long-chain fatty acid--CoA ligase [Bacteroidetes bacterium]|nr:long-chain fatty acid--CoA ligase [Bacteroidota bacterium]
MKKFLEILQHWAKRSEAIALHFSEEDASWTYSNLVEELGKVHAFLRFYGVKAGDKVAVLSGNSSEMVFLLLGCLTYNAVWMPVNPGLKQSEVRELIQHADPCLVLFAKGRDKLIPSAWAAMPLESYAPFRSTNLEAASHLSEGGVLIYTSGTTGNPKGILLSERQLLANIQGVQPFLEKGPATIAACFLPLFHLFGVQSDLLGTLVHGGKVVVLPEFDLRQIASLAQAICTNKVNTFSAVPLMFDLLLRFGAAIPFGQLAYCVSGGAPMPPDLKKRFEVHFGTEVLAAYGVTEAACFCLCPRKGIHVNGSVGHPTGIEIAIIDAKGKRVVSGEIGELLIRGESVIQDGYFRDSRNCYLELDGKPWFRTGDLGKQDQAGCYFITGRLKNMVIKGGTKIYLEDIDYFLQGLEEVKEAVCLRLAADSNAGIEGFACFVVRNAESQNSVDAAIIRKKLREALGPDKVAEQVIFLDKFNRTASGKIKTGELQDQLSCYDH